LLRSSSSGEYVATSVHMAAHVLGVGLHDEQVALDVRVLDDGDPRSVDVPHLGDVHTLDTLLGVLDRLQVGRRRRAQPLQADADARFVHHVEHVLDALVLLADQPAVAGAVRAEHQRAGGGAVDAHLVLDVAADHVVVRAERVVGVDRVPGHHEQAHALDPLGRALDAGQHHVNDVAGHVVLAGGDEDLLALDEEVIPLPLGLGLEIAHRAARAGLGQAHRAAPFAAEHPGNDLLHLLGPVRLEQTPRRAAESRGQDKGDGSRALHLDDGGLDNHGQPLAAQFHGTGRGDPAAVLEGIIGLAALLGGDDVAVFELETFPVQDGVERVEDVDRDLDGLVHDHVEHLPVQLAESREFAESLDVEVLVQAEHDISLIHGEWTHILSLLGFVCLNRTFDFWVSWFSF